MKYLNTLIFLIIIGCSSSSKMMIGKEAEFLTGDQVENLKLTAELDKLISIEKYRLINIYLRNLNVSWLRIKNTEILEVSNGDRFHVILGNDLDTWLKSINLDYELKKKEYAERKEEFPTLKNYDVKDHIYKKFSVPSQLQTNKWVLLQLKSSKLTWVKIKLHFIDGSKQIYKVNIK